MVIKYLCLRELFKFYELLEFFTATACQRNEQALAILKSKSKAKITSAQNCT